MPLSLPRTALVPLIISCGMFMEILDGSIISTALPAIAQSLQTDPLHLNLAITAYLFSLALFIPLSGWMADRFGARSVFRTAMLIFTLSSMGCGFAQNLLQLVAARFVQGLGGALMVPVGRLVLLRTVPKAGLVNAMVWLTTPAMIAPVMGPPLGGFIVTYSTWRWIFFINLPIGILGMVLATLFIDNVREEDVDPLDWRGFALMAGGLAGLVFSFETIGRHMVPGEFVAALFFCGIACVGLYLRHAGHVLAPIVDMSLFRLPTFRASIAGGSLFRIGFGALPFLLPMMLQIGFGLTPLSSGLLTFSSAAGALAVRPVAGLIIRHFGFRRMMIGNALIGGVSIFLCSLFRPGTAHVVILSVLLAGGFFRSLQFLILNTLVFAEVPDDRMSRATTLFSMLQQLFLSVGVGTGALLLSLTLSWHQSTNLNAHDFYPAFVGVGLISALSVVFFLPLKPDAGAELSGHGIAPHQQLANSRP